MEYVDLDVALEAARGGDDWAVTCVFRAVHPALLHYIRRHAPDAAEDLVSETWLAAAKGFPSFVGDADDFRAWLFTIAKRRVADHYRSRARSPQLAVLTDEAASPAVVDGTFEDTVIENLSTDRAIGALVRDLSADQAEVVLLRVVADLSVDQVAKIMGRSPGSVRVLQHRALRRLAKIWDRGAVTR